MCHEVLQAYGMLNVTQDSLPPLPSQLLSKPRAMSDEHAERFQDGEQLAQHDGGGTSTGCSCMKSQSQSTQDWKK